MTTRADSIKDTWKQAILKRAFSIEEKERVWTDSFWLYKQRAIRKNQRNRDLPWIEKQARKKEVECNATDLVDYGLYDENQRRGVVGVSLGRWGNRGDDPPNSHQKSPTWTQTKD